MQAKLYLVMCLHNNTLGSSNKVFTNLGAIVRLFQKPRCWVGSLKNWYSKSLWFFQYFKEVVWFWVFQFSIMDFQLFSIFKKRVNVHKGPLAQRTLARKYYFLMVIDKFSKLTHTNVNSLLCQRSSCIQEIDIPTQIINYTFNVQDGIQNYKPYFHLLGQMFDCNNMIIIHVHVLIHMCTNVILKK